MIIATVYKGLSNKPRVVELPAGASIKDALPLEDTGRAAIFVNNKAADDGHILKEGDSVFVRLFVGDLSNWSTAGRVALAIFTFGISEAVNWGVQMYKNKVAAEKALAELEKLKSQTNSDIDNRPFLRGASNTVATSKTQPYICGRHLFAPYLLADTFYEISGTDGETQHANIILECGFNKQVIHTVGCDDVNILELSDSSPQEGSYSTNAGSSFADGTAEIAQDGNLLAALPNLNYKHVSTTANEEVPKTSEISSGEAEDYIFTLDAHALDVEVCIAFTNGLYAYNDDGDKTDTSVTITPQYSLDGGSTWTSFTFYDSYNNKSTNTFSRKTSSKELRYTATKTFTLANYKTLYNNGERVIQCRVRSNGNTDSQICNTCYVLYYQSVCFDPNTSSSPAGILDDNGAAGLVKCLVLNERERAKSTMLALRLKSTASNEDKLSKIFIISSGVARTWNGKEWSSTKSVTRNPAAWALEILTSDTHALSKFSDSEIDLESFGEFYEHCEENDYYFDYVISQKAKKDTVLGYITDSCGAALYTDIYGRKAIAIDRVQENAVAVYNPQNIISIENEREFARRTDCVRVTYTNSEDDLYEEDTYTVMREENGVALELTEDSVITDVTTSGITTYEHAVKYARRLMAIESLRPKKTTIEVGNEGIFLTPYSKVLIQDDSMKIGTGNAVVAGVEWQGGVAQYLHLKNPVTIEEGKSYGCIVQCFKDGEPAMLSLKVSGEVGLVAQLYIEDRITTASSLYPEGGETLSFGELENGEFTKITTPYVIAGITRAEQGFSLELVNYNEAIFETGTIPDYASNITQKPSSASADVPAGNVSLDDVYAAAKSAANGIVNGTTAVGEPDTPANVEAVAGQDGISLSCVLGILGLRNDIAEVTWELTRSDGSVAEATSSGRTGTYSFDRSVDGYPESEELMQWTARCKARNHYGYESEWSSAASVSTEGYGTWTVSAPSLSVAVSARTITLTILQPALASGKTRYGTFFNRIWIQKPSEGEDWLKPASTLDPYASEDNWNEGEGYITVEGTWSQTMPLDGQTLVETEVEGETVWQSSPVATLYRFRAQAYSEAGEGDYSEINATALGTGIQDIVQGSVTHDKISTPSLSAITANMGVISSGGFTGSELNYWALSSILGMAAQGIADMYEGAFRVGGTDEYILVEPQVTNSVVTGYKIFFKAGVFEVTAAASTINGELVVQASEDALDRTRITPTGTYWEHRETAESDWQMVVQVTQSGVRASTLISAASLVISNMGIAERRALGHDIGRAYLSGAARVWHFDTDFLDQNQEEGLAIGGDAILAAAGEYAELGIDFSPAILAVSPYAEDVKVAYGQFSASISLAETNSLTVDFWIQYIWNEDQTLFDVGGASDGIRLVLANAEPYWNDYDGGRDAAPFNQEQLEAGGVVVWNEPGEASATIQHYGSGQATESQALEDLGIAFNAGEWLHVGIAMTETAICAFLDTKQAQFRRFAQAAMAADVSINALEGSLILDELYIDTGAAESFSDFSANTVSRIPWGALDHGQAHFVIDAECLHTNIFDTEAFNSKVKEVLANS